MRARRWMLRGANADLAAGERARRNAALAQRHGQQRDRHLLAGGQQHIHFTRVGFARDARGEIDEAIGGVAHRRDHDGDAIAACANRRDFLGDSLDELHRAHRGAAVFLDDRFAGAPLTRRVWCARTLRRFAAPRRAPPDCCRPPARSPDGRRPCRRPGRPRCPTSSPAFTLPVWSAVTPATSVILLVASTDASTMTADLSLSLS